MRWLGLIPAAIVMGVALFAIWQDLGPAGFQLVLLILVAVLGGLAFAAGVV